MILTARSLTKKTQHPILNLFARYKFSFAKKKKKKKKRKEKKLPTWVQHSRFLLMQVHTSIRHSSLVFLGVLVFIFCQVYALTCLKSFLKIRLVFRSETLICRFLNHPSILQIMKNPLLVQTIVFIFFILFWLNNIYIYCVFLLIHHLTLYICLLVVSFFKVLTLNFSWFFWTRFNSAATLETIISTHSHKVNCYITIAKAEFY